MVENNVRKGENHGCQHFLLFPHGFLSQGRFKSRLFCKELNAICKYLQCRDAVLLMLDEDLSFRCSQCLLLDVYIF